MKYLLDSNAWIAIQRGHQGVRRRLEDQSPGDIFLSSPVFAELYAGVLKSQRQRENMAFIDDISAQYDCLHFGIAEAARFAQLAVAMGVDLKSMKTFDLQIASIASVHGLRIVTHDTADFGRIPGIDLEDWQE